VAGIVPVPTGRRRGTRLGIGRSALVAHGRPALVVDQPGSFAQVVINLAMERGVAIAYVPGLVMRRAAQLYPGPAKTDARDSRGLADTGRVYAERLRWLELLDDLARFAVRFGRIAFFDPRRDSFGHSRTEISRRAHTALCNKPRVHILERIN